MNLSSGKFLLLYLSLASLFLFLRVGTARCEQGTRNASGNVALSAPYKYEIGERYVYRISFKNSSVSDFSELFKSMNTPGEESTPPPAIAFSIRTSLKGELTETVLGKRDGGFLIAYTIRNARIAFTSNGQKDPDQAEVIRTDFNKPFYARVDHDGKITQTWAEQDVTTMSQTYFKGMLALARVIFPSDLSKNGSWDVQEEDPAGYYIARYKEMRSKSKIAGGAPVMTFLKKKVRYLEPETRPETSHTVELPVIIKPRGEFRADFDFSLGILKSISGSESQNLTINKKNVGRASSSIDVKHMRTEAIEPAALSKINGDFSLLEKKVKPTPLYARPSREESEREIQTKELGDATLESLLAALKKAEAAKDPKFNATPLYLKFKALIYLHPESCAALGEVLKDAPAGSMTMRLLPTALNTVGSPQAQAALVTAVKAHMNDKDALIPLLTSLATLEEPIEETQATLEEVAFKSTDKDISSTALLSLGSQARRLANFSPARAEKIIGEFTKELKKSQSPEATRLVLLALGNTGSSLALPEISRFAADPSPDLRTPAVFALRFISGEEAEALIIKALLSDEDAGVRLSATSALFYRKISGKTFGAQKEAFMNDKDEKVRLALLGNLWKVRDDFPEVIKLVRKVAAKDPSKDVRKAAQSLLKNLQ
jgi:HEAT repeat protein